MVIAAMNYSKSFVNMISFTRGIGFLPCTTFAIPTVLSDATNFLFTAWTNPRGSIRRHNKIGRWLGCMKRCLAQM